jgi:hypothetical protein
VVQHFALPVEALDQKLIDGFLGKIIVQGFSEGFQGKFNTGGAFVTAGGAVAAEGLDGNGAAILTVAVSPENDDEPVFDHAGDDHIVNLHQTQEEVGHLDAGICAFDLPQIADNPVPVTPLVVKGKVVILEKTLRNLIQFNAPYKLTVGTGIGQIIEYRF